MVTYNITHTTEYTYSEPVPVCHNRVHLAPRTLDHQTCHEFSLMLNPTPPYGHRRFDYFGNQVDYFSIHVAHPGLTVTANSRVDVSTTDVPDPRSTPPWCKLVDAVQGNVSSDGLSVYQFAFPSPYIPVSAQMADYARHSFPASRPVLQGALDLTERIHSDFRYDAQATTISSSLSEVFEGRAGVCQDFAHLQLACLRSLGLPARYVSGYLRTQSAADQRQWIGADASHAWASVWCGPVGWVDLDPTNNVIPSLDHITIAWGRDYGDVCPIQGVAIGGARHVMSVSVDVRESTAQESR